MIIRQIISVLSLLVVAGSVTAGVVKVDLKTGLIKSGETIVINLDALVPAHIYKLDCSLSSDHTSGKPYNLVSVTTPTNASAIGVTAEETSPGSHQYQLPTTMNSHLYGNITKDIGNISITNLDDSDSVLLSSCHAIGRM